MKEKKIILLLLFILSTHLFYGFDKNKDSINKIDKIKKWAVVKMTLAYMEDLREWNSETKSIKTSEFKTYKLLVNKYNKFNENVNLEEISTILENGWKISRDDLFNLYRADYENEKFNLNNIKIYPITGNLSELKRQESIKSIKNEFKNQFKIENLPIKKSTKEVSKKEVNTTTLNTEVVKNGSPKTSIIVYFVCFLLLISMLLNYWFFTKWKKSSSKNEQMHKSHNDKLHNKNLEIVEIKKEFEKKGNIESKNSNQEKRGNKNTKENNTINVNQVKKVKSKAIETKVKTIYLPSPFEEKKFANEDVSETKTEASFYQINFNTNTNKGDITIIKNIDLTRALNSPNIFLEKACDFENMHRVDAKGIEVIKNSNISLKGNDWVMENKLKIKFI